MKDILLRSKATLIALALWWYITRLLVSQAIVTVSPEHTLTALVLCLLVVVYLLAITLRQSRHPDNRRQIALIGVFTVFLAQTYLIDDVASQVYLRDFMKIFWVYLIIAGPTKMLFSEKAKEERFEKEVEIIEV